MPKNRKAAEAADGVQGVYLIGDLTANKVYVGSSVELPKRLAAHETALKRNAHPNWQLQRAFNKGHQLEVTPIPVKPGEDVLSIEQALLNEYRSSGLLYNIAEDATAPMLGRTHTDETKKKMSEARTGVLRSAETIEKTRLAQTGRVMSDEFRDTCRQNRLGATLSDETKEKIRLASTGQLHTAETKKKLSDIAKNRINSPEQIKNLTSRLGNPAVPFTLDGVTYESQGDAARSLGISKSTVRRKLVDLGVVK